MQADQIASTVWILLAIVLVASGLIARRLPWGKSAALVASWVGIILAVWALVLAVQKLA
jgi:aspartyl protease family protein